jgi:cytochrome P450
MDAQVLTDDLASEARLDQLDFFLGDPYPTYARLRREAPVYWCEAGQFWALTKHADIVWAENQGNPPLTSLQGLYIPEALRPENVKSRDAKDVQSSSASFMSDPPGHTRFRRLVLGAFSPKRLIDLEPRIRAISEEVLDELPDGEQINFVEALSVPLAIRVIAEFLGVPPEHWQDLRRWSDSFMSIIGGAFPEGSPEALRAAKDQEEMLAFFAQSLADRRREPREDLMSTVAGLELNGEPVPEPSQVHVCLSVLSAGNETVRNTLSGSMVTFAEFPDQWDRLVADPSLLGNAVEELLRWVCPVTHFGRRATEPLTIRDQPIAEGDFIAMLYGAGNRDEEVWPDGDRFDVARSTTQKHLSFGWGVHSCIGAGLARSEIRTVLEGMRERFAGWELTGETARNPSMVVNDYKSVPLILTRR